MATHNNDRGAQSLLYRETRSHPASFSAVPALRLRSAPLLAVAMCFSAGILCRGWWQPAAQMALLCGLLGAVAWLALLRAPRLAPAAVGLVWIALGWTAVHLQPAGVDTSLVRYADGLQRSVEGRVMAVRRLPSHGPPVESTLPSRELHGDEESLYAARGRARDAVYSMDLAVRGVEEITPDASNMAPIAGGVQVTVFAEAGAVIAEPPCGALVRLTLRLHAPQRFLDPGVWQYADHLAARGISVQSNAEARTLHILDAAHTPWRCRFLAAQRWSVDRLQMAADSPLLQHLPRAARFTPDDVAMLSAMLFGDRTRLSPERRVAFERTGSFHLFVVAGLHIAVLLGLLYTGFLRMRMPVPVAAFAALLLTAAYALLTGFGAPVQRALLMSAVYLFTTLLGRERNPLNAIGAAVLAMLLLQPGALFESGFQMTVLAVLAIAGMAAPIAERTVMPFARALQTIWSVRSDPYHSPRLTQMRVSLRWIGEELWPTANTPRTPAKRFARWAHAAPAFLVRCALLLVGVLLVTVCAETVMALPMEVYFHRLTPFAAPANLIALPLVAPLMVCAALMFLLSLLHPWAAVLPSALTALLLHGVSWVVERLGALRAADVRVAGPPLLCILLAALLWWGSVVLLRKVRRIQGLSACALLLLASVFVLWQRRPSLHAGALEFTAIDVGQGDSLLVASPRGSVMLIDAGGPTGSAGVVPSGGFDIGEQVVSPYLWSRGIRHVDILVLTHAHSDHIGGMAAVLRNVSPRELWVSVEPDTAPFRALLREAQRHGTRVRQLHRGDREAWDGTDVEVLGPAANYQPHRIPTNDDSLVLRIAYGRASVLAEGDAEHPWEADFAQTPQTPVTLLKVGHHGSNTSTSAEFLEAIHPAAAVISCGAANHFGHPRMAGLQRLQRAGVRTARTDNMGAVQYLLHADGSIETRVLASNP